MKQNTQDRNDEEKTDSQDVAMAYLAGDVGRADAWLERRRLKSLDFPFIKHHGDSFDPLKLLPVMNTPFVKTPVYKTVSALSHLFLGKPKSHKMKATHLALPAPTGPKPKQSLNFEINRGNYMQFKKIASGANVPENRTLTTAFEHVLQPATQSKLEQWDKDFPRFAAINKKKKKKMVNVKSALFPTFKDSELKTDKDKSKKEKTEKKAQKARARFVPENHLPYVANFSQDHGNSCYAFLTDSIKFIDRPFVILKMDSSLELTKLDKKTYQSHFHADVMVIWLESHFVCMDTEGNLRALPREEADRVLHTDDGYYIDSGDAERVYLSPMIRMNSDITMQLSSRSKTCEIASIEQSIDIDLMHQTFLYHGPNYGRSVDQYINPKTMAALKQQHPLIIMQNSPDEAEPAARPQFVPQFEQIKAKVKAPVLDKPRLKAASPSEDKPVPKTEVLTQDKPIAQTESPQPPKLLQDYGMIDPLEILMALQEEKDEPAADSESQKPAARPFRMFAL